MSIASTRMVPTYPDPGESSRYEVTYDDYMAMDETNQHVEIVDGVIHVFKSPTIQHQVVVGNFLTQMIPHLRRERTGLFLHGPCDVVIRKLPKLSVRQPDLFYFSNVTAGFDTETWIDRVQEASHAGTLSPALVIEVLSPGENERTLAGKLADYASIEINEVWFADQEAKSICVLVREGAAYRPAGEFQAGDSIVSIILPGLDLDPTAIFGG